uniref:Uncharacterized protein n=1 Tax=Anguilla anguilla TaxID=7936 RepID=A0A0E9XT33_ANGAN
MDGHLNTNDMSESALSSLKVGENLNPITLGKDMYPLPPISHHQLPRYSWGWIYTYLQAF